MLKRSRSLIAAVVLLLSASASADWIEDSDKNSMIVLRAQAAFQPESVAAAGLNDFDGEIIDLGANYVDRREASDRELVVELERRLADESHPKIRQDLDILIQSLTDGIEARRAYHERLLPYINVHRLLFSSFNSLLDPRNDRERYASCLLYTSDAADECVKV